MKSYIIAGPILRELAVLACLLAPGCMKASPPEKNVVCILIDQLRKDAADQTAVRINRVAAQGVVFEDMRTVSPWTYPSVISLMSGLYPQQHGANGRSDNVLSTFDPRVPLVQGLLKPEGYKTAAFITNQFLHDWNPFHKGFDAFDGDFIKSEGNIRAKGKLIWIPETMFAHYVNQKIMEHFDDTPLDAPEFTYIHYIDVHGPWTGAPFEGDYYSAIRFIDKRVIEIYEYFMKRYDGSLIFFVTSDHGMARKDDERIGYGKPWRKTKNSVHDFNLQIPFWIFPSKIVKEPRLVQGPCSTVDFVPTLLDWLGIEAKHPFPGMSLLPAILEGEALPPDRPIYAKTSAWGHGESDCIVFEGKKYMRFFDVDTKEVKEKRVFDLRKDPRECKSLEQDFDQVVPLLEKESGLHKLHFPARYEEVSTEVKEKLKALGYL